MSDQVTAYHEAGHAALLIYFGEDSTELTIERAGDAAGHAEIDRSDDDALRHENDLQKQVIFERRIMVAFAGVIAQRRFAPRSVRAIHGATDRQLAAEYFAELHTPNEKVLRAYVRLLELRTEALVDELWARIERIAGALMRQRTLTGDEVRAAFVDPARAAELADDD